MSDLPTDPAVIQANREAEARKAAEFDRLLRDNRLVRLQADMHHALAKRVGNLEDRLAKMTVGRLDTQAVRDALEGKWPEKAKAYRPRYKSPRRPTPEKVEVWLVEATPWPGDHFSLAGDGAVAYDCKFTARVLDEIGEPATGSHHMDWKWEVGDYPQIHKTGQKGELSGMLECKSNRIAVRVRAAGPWVPENKWSEWSHPVEFRIEPRDFSLVAHHGQVRKWRNCSWDKPWNVDDGKDEGDTLNVL